ncbi:peptidase U32 family protein [Loigolactobacillus backii]|uniref:Peptidase U32 n=1 Tax=Loigolactobacillus backii TaxID=375175 RepID=A0A192H358_9LACO|nr:peptidase U32 family protein [Loigolactobacillus backii]ANK62396.1 peptidase U32 [Loigolactobacillus backii]ANK70592.1 peptidase U32 [Loigolactobacillus backii]MDA5388686.1 U32 family peptidase [Loigolactobacillus backii]MDA5391162.1 U32 family peptidase [Loigolactobacillus backii]
MIDIIATVDSQEQAKMLLTADVDTLYLGEDFFGLRLPHSFKRSELAEIVQLAHAAGKKVTVAVNAIMHNDRIAKVANYLDFLADLQVDQITVGDPGVIYLLQQKKLNLPFIYDAEVLVTSARQVNFWAKHGASGAVIAREVPHDELTEMVTELQIPGEIQVYGATCIHQSGRPLLHNYFNFVKEHQDRADRARGLFVSAPHKPETHYSIYEDFNGTHVFANNDLNLITKLAELNDLGLTHWKLDGLFADHDQFVNIAQIFVAAKKAILAQKWTPDLAEQLDGQVGANQPANRGLDTGFYEIDPSEVQ